MAFFLFMVIIWLFILGVKCIPDIKRKIYLDNERKKLENIRLHQNIIDYNTKHNIKTSYNDSLNNVYDLKDNIDNDIDLY